MDDHRQLLTRQETSPTILSWAARPPLRGLAAFLAKQQRITTPIESSATAIAMNMKLPSRLSAWSAVIARRVGPTCRACRVVDRI